MIVVLVDTNILLHALNSDSPEHEGSRTALETLANGNETWVLTWGIIYEFYRVATHPRIFPKPLAMDKAHEFIAGLLGCPSCLLIAETASHRAALETSLGQVQRLSGNLLHDFHTAVLMREHGVQEVLTLDTDFRAFAWVAVRGM
ncbi:MAG: PIN domain-containing protein [Kiritimatiellae bacterium]|nr:PIN domain-containing protein [Kiritimatiellia bacterium]